MKKSFCFLVFVSLLFSCNKDEGLNLKEDTLLTTRSSKDVQIKVSNPDTKNAAGEVVAVFLGVPSCTCENANTPDSNCKATDPIILLADGNSDPNFVTDKNGKVMVVGSAKGFASNADYTACVGYFANTPCTLNLFENCGNTAGYGKCTWAATCVKFTTNKKGGTQGQVKIKKK